ncbi:hypothetical protein J6590_017720 [Homalodisca vitripennis]|nr:hypothetical protein J6590_017720 [Homalodisca vitripennis]
MLNKYAEKNPIRPKVFPTDVQDPRQPQGSSPHNKYSIEAQRVTYLSQRKSFQPGLENGPVYFDVRIK